jgi:hypothetical protein
VVSHSLSHSVTQSLTQVLRLRPGDRRGLLGPCRCEGEDEDEDEEGRQGEGEAGAGARRSSPPRHRYSGGVAEWRSGGVRE